MDSIASFARNYKNGLIISRLNSIILVEDKSSKIFWTFVFGIYAPSLRFKVIVKPKIVGRDGNVKKHSNVHSVLKYLPFADCKLVVCKDSDYEYLLQNSELNNKEFLFQTYTYSVENYFCYAPSLRDVCKKTTLEDNIEFDFEDFLKQYSNIVFELFVRTYQNELERSKLFSKISLPGIIDLSNPQLALTNLKTKVAIEISRLKRFGPIFDLETQIILLGELGLTPENTYLFLRGHNILDSVVKHLVQSVTRKYSSIKTKFIREEFTGEEVQNEVGAYLAKTLTAEEALNTNSDFKDCFLFDKIIDDVQAFIRQCYPNLK